MSEAKAQAQMKHAVRRAQERYGVVLSEGYYHSLCNDIRNGIGVCLGKQSNRVTIWRIAVMNPTSWKKPGDPLVAICVVAYDKNTHSICTFLPPDITDAKGVSLSID